RKGRRRPARPHEPLVLSSAEAPPNPVKDERILRESCGVATGREEFPAEGSIARLVARAPSNQMRRAAGRLPVGAGARPPPPRPARGARRLSGPAGGPP